MDAVNTPTSPTTDNFNRIRAYLNPPLLALLLAIGLFFAGELIAPGFANPRQALNIVTLAAFLSFIAAGQTLVIISGSEGIDLSIGAVVTLGAILVFRYSDGKDELILPALGLALSMGAVVGLINGLGITFLSIPPLVMTLSMAGVVNGSIYVVTEKQLIGDTPELMKDLISRKLIGDIPGVIIAWLIFGLLIWFLLERTPYGKQLFAIGVNRTTARLSGISVTQVVITTYMLSGMLAALGGFMLLGFTQTVFLNLGDDYLFPSVAAVVIGGTLLSGGKGSYFGTMSGALVLTLIQSLLRARQMEQAYQYIILGVVLVLLLSVYGRQRALRG
jgi:ribose transport system permease protein